MGDVRKIRHMKIIMLGLRLAMCAALVAPFLSSAAETNPSWKTLFNGKDFSGWDKWLAAPPEETRDPKRPKNVPYGLNNDPLDVFTIVDKDGAKAIRVSGQVWGAITTHEEFGNARIRVEYKWGEKKWPPRALPIHYRDSGLLYWAIGPHGAGSGAWMRSVECNIMEKGVGQWWGVDATYVDIEGKKVVLEKEPSVPYRGEGPGEECIVYQPGGPQFTTGEGITSPIDPERAGDWNVCEVICWGNVGIHLLNGKVVLVLTNPRYKEGGLEKALTRGKIQLQSEGAEIFYRKAEVQLIDEIPAEFLSHIPPGAPGETGFTPLFGKDARDGWSQCGPGDFVLENGVATARGGMGLWWYSKRMFTNFVLRGEFKQEQPIADSGVFLRFPNPGNDPWNAVKQGHEMEIGDEKSDKPTWHTGSFYPFHAPASINVKPVGEWNEYEIVCIGQNYSARLNGRVVNTWTDSSHRTDFGYIGLQNYNDDKTVRHRNLRIKELP
jgi:hypothetical protein